MDSTPTVRATNHKATIELGSTDTFKVRNGDASRFVVIAISLARAADLDRDAFID